MQKSQIAVSINNVTIAEHSHRAGRCYQIERSLLVAVTKSNYSAPWEFRNEIRYDFRGKGSRCVNHIEISRTYNIRILSWLIQYGGRFNAVNSLEDPHIRYHIVCPMGRAMGCLLWVRVLVYVTLELLQCCMEYHVIFDRVWTAPVEFDTSHGPLTRCGKFRVRMRRECRECFPRHRGQAIPACITACAWRTCRDACQDR